MTERGGPEVIARKQAERVRAIVAFAREHSPYYRELYRDLPPDAPFTALPPVNKRDLIARFDDWVTDPNVKWRDVEAFIAHPDLIGARFRGDYTVSLSSGSIGIPGTILQDPGAREVYDALGANRGGPGFGKTLSDGLKYLRRGFRAAAIVFTGGHYGSATAMAGARRRYPWLANRLRTFSILAPQQELIAQLNAYKPTHIITYPSMATVLARAQQAGKLALRPVNIFTGGETLTPDARVEIEQVMGCRIHDIYNANEFPNMAQDCSAGWLHLNTDWLVLEPVDRNYQPVPPGQASHSALLTNMANRIQPFIRYEMGDSVTVRPDPCPCGDIFPAIRAVGRTSEVLTFTTGAGASIDVAWGVFYGIIDVEERAAGFQVIQIAPARLRIRLEIRLGHETETEAVWARVLRDVRAFLDNNDLRHVELVRAPEPPQSNPVTGKYRRVWREYD